MSASSAAFSPDHLSPSDQLCYVHCNFCDTVLAVSYLSLSLISLSSRSISSFAPFLFFFFVIFFFFNEYIHVYSHMCVFWQVSVPCSSLFKSVTVRCGHCTNLLSVNMRGLLLPAANQLHLGHAFFTPQNLLVYKIL